MKRGGKKKKKEGRRPQNLRNDGMVIDSGDEVFSTLTCMCSSKENHNVYGFILIVGDAKEEDKFPQWYNGTGSRAKMEKRLGQVLREKTVQGFFIRLNIGLIFKSQKIT